MITVWQPGYLKPLDRFMPTNREAKTEMEKYKYKERHRERDNERESVWSKERDQLLLSRHKPTKCGSLFCCCCAACAPLAVSSTCCKPSRLSVAVARNIFFTCCSFVFHFLVRKQLQLSFFSSSLYGHSFAFDRVFMCVYLSVRACVCVRFHCSQTIEPAFVLKPARQDSIATGGTSTTTSALPATTTRRII